MTDRDILAHGAGCATRIGPVVLPSVPVSRNLSFAIIPSPASSPPGSASPGSDTVVTAPAGGRPVSVVLVGMPGAGKTSVGRRLAQRLGLPFLDADAEIEAAAGQPVTEIFARYGEPHFREGERRVIARLLDGPPIVLATGGGAFNDPETRAAVRASGAVSVWLRATLPTLLDRVSGRTTRPLFLNADPLELLTRLMKTRHPYYAEADLVTDCLDTDTPEATAEKVAAALAGWRAPARLPVALGQRSYDVVVGEDLLARAGMLMAPVLPARRVAIVSDAHVAPLHLATLREGLEAAEFEIRATIGVPPGEGSKSLESFGQVLETLLAAGIDRRTTVIALGGGVVGDLAGFVAASALRGLPFVQIPTTLLAQVDSSVGGKTGINLKAGKNLAGAFHQPAVVLADTGTLATLPARELRAGYAEVAKHGLLQGPLWDWCEAHGARAVAGEADALRHAVLESCRLKSAVVAADEREESAEGGRALLNLGHTFGHALEAECGYDGTLLHGEAVAIGLGLAARLSARLGHCDAGLPGRVEAHIAAVGLPARIRDLPRGFTVEALMGRMRKDKKVRDGALRFVLLRAPGEVFTAGDVPAAEVEALLREEGCAG
ncbi:3-dehydroquinate synthase [Roseomonas marmotae]|uniref:Multifunctional fusion protein n=1 Tax=Roseomonas marmotae TaxID=2768161 RepID=A0ABS3KFP8_9PROT|nr:3-dehydroquinate synthase [Roseomonas marmotae]MBO1076300.1 3-dehydroquinate synthase [Roseomonas marmotae]QTI80543.1 3-dehydroquinate synthase [Roseomonas marmotae]